MFLVFMFNIVFAFKHSFLHYEDQFEMDSSPLSEENSQVYIKFWLIVIVTKSRKFMTEDQ